MITFSIQTMGCKVNTYDTSLLEKQLTRSGFVPVKSSPLVQIINSCAVTETASLETHKQVKHLKEKSPSSVVVVTGCVAQVDVERLRNLTGADLIIGNSHKGDFDRIVRDFIEKKDRTRVHHSNIFRKTDLGEGGGIENSKTRAFLKIQDGCNSFCSFCIIPFARGQSRSLPADHLVARVNELHAAGFQEAVLTGVHCGDYDDKGLTFSDLVEKILRQTKIPRIRLSSLEPIEVTDKLWSLFKNESRLCPHIHVSLQSASSSVLRRMKRKYSQSDIADFFEKAGNAIPNGFIGMDVIAGFPGESEKEFEDTYHFLEGRPWTRIHVFPYSIRPGTAAAKMAGHLASQTIKTRASQLRSLSLFRQRQRADSQVGTVKKILVLQNESHGAHGLSRDYWAVKIRNFDQLRHVNCEVDARIVDSAPLNNGEAVLIAELIENKGLIC